MQEMLKMAYLAGAKLAALESEELVNAMPWLVPGLVGQKVTALIRSLPKHLRRNFVPAPDTASQIVDGLAFGKGNLLSLLHAVN